MRFNILRCFFFRIRFRRFFTSEPIRATHGIAKLLGLTYFLSNFSQDRLWSGVSSLATALMWCPQQWPVVQLVERLSLEQEVVGSRPARPANKPAGHEIAGFDGQHEMA